LLQASDNDLDKFLRPRNPKPCLGLVLVDLPSGCRPSAIPDWAEAPESRSSLALRLFFIHPAIDGRDIGPRSNSKNLRGGLETKNKRFPYPLVVKTWPANGVNRCGLFVTLAR
jgi:hypothetical protein